MWDAELRSDGEGEEDGYGGGTACPVDAVTAAAPAPPRLPGSHAAAFGLQGRASPSGQMSQLLAPQMPAVAGNVRACVICKADSSQVWVRVDPILRTTVRSGLGPIRSGARYPTVNIQVFGSRDTY